MITDSEFNCILEECKKLPPAKGWYLINDYITNLFITVLDFRLNEKIVTKAIDFYKNNRRKEIRSHSDLKKVFKKYPDNKDGNTKIAEYLWGYQYSTRVSLLRKLLKYFEDRKVTTQKALKEWASTSSYEKDFKGKIKGMAIAVYQWLVMRQGIETVKPDIHVRRFVKSVIHRSISDEELVETLERVAKQLSLKAYELDWRIWEYQRGIKYD